MIKAYYTVELRNNKGKTLKRKKYKSHSFLKQFAQMLYCILGTTFNSSCPSQSVLDVNGAARTYPYCTQAFNVTVPTCDINLTTAGIVIGTGSTANTVDTYKLASLLTSGISVLRTERIAPSVSDNSITFGLKKEFRNLTGSTQYISEVGIYARADDSGGAIRDFCIVRDVLPEPIEFPNGYILTITYNFTITVS